MVNAGQFQFGFSIFILAMVIIGGLGSIWGAVVGGLALGYINNYLIPDVLNNLPSQFGLNFQLTQVEFGIFGFLLVIMMLLRPQGLIPERRRRLELTGQIAAEDAQLVEAPGQRRDRHEPRSMPRRRRGRGPARGARHQGVRRAGRRQRRLVRRPAALDRVADRAERRREDDPVQHADRAVPADRRAASTSASRDITRARART